MVVSGIPISSIWLATVCRKLWIVQSGAPSAAGTSALQNTSDTCCARIIRPLTSPQGNRLRLADDCANVLSGIGCRLRKLACPAIQHLRMTLFVKMDGLAGETRGDRRP